MGLMTNDFAGTDATEALIRPALLIEAARTGSALHLRRKREPMPRAAVARIACAEETHETLRRQRSPVYRPAAHVEALAILLAERSRRR